jgi:hypothetical protein
MNHQELYLLLVRNYKIKILNLMKGFTTKIDLSLRNGKYLIETTSEYNIIKNILIKTKFNNQIVVIKCYQYNTEINRYIGVSSKDDINYRIPEK